MHFYSVAVSPKRVSLRAGVISWLTHNNRMTLTVGEANAGSEDAAWIVGFGKQHRQFQHMPIDFEERCCTCAVAGKSRGRSRAVQNNTLSRRTERHE